MGLKPIEDGVAIVIEENTFRIPEIEKTEHVNPVGPRLEVPQNDMGRISQHSVIDQQHYCSHQPRHCNGRSH